MVSRLCDDEPRTGAVGVNKSYIQAFGLLVANLGLLLYLTGMPDAVLTVMASVLGFVGGLLFAHFSP